MNIKSEYKKLLSCIELTSIKKVVYETKCEEHELTNLCEMYGGVLC